MRKELKNNNIDRENYAYLMDHVLKNKGKKQLYGTQMTWDSLGNHFPYPIKDSVNVDKRRIEMGLNSLNHYLKFFESLNN